MRVSSLQRGGGRGREVGREREKGGGWNSTRRVFEMGLLKASSQSVRQLLTVGYIYILSADNVPIQLHQSVIQLASFHTSALNFRVGCGKGLISLAVSVPNPISTLGSRSGPSYVHSDLAALCQMIGEGAGMGRWGWSTPWR